jgi:uncharacterized protein YrzB (UPF0473 family)
MNDEKHECGCGCGCDNDHEQEEMETMILTLDDDTELECGIIGVFEVEGKDYIALLPSEEENVLIYEYKETDDDVELGMIEDDDLFEKVSTAFNEIWDEEDSEDEE